MKAVVADAPLCAKVRPLNARILILAVLIGPLTLFAQVLPPGIYRDFFADGGRVLVLSIPTNGPIELLWGEVNPITGEMTKGFAGVATNKPNGRIIGKFPGLGGLRGRVSDGGTNGVSGTFRLLLRDGERVFIRVFERRFHALPR